MDNNHEYGIDPLDMAAYETVHEYRNAKTGKRGPGALAPLVGMAPSTLSNKCNPNEIYANLTLKEARQVVLASGDSRIVKQFALDAGFTILPMPEVDCPADMDILNAWADWQADIAETIEAVKAAIAGSPTKEKVETIRRELHEDLAQGMKLFNIIDDMLEPDDKLPTAVRQLHKA
ncbi:MAG: hypothetical protein OQL08_09070 [Gammaproteobacteria bacterium]|nr:hypothetical protein [Gammaproteobacteria bacterium]